MAPPPEQTSKNQKKPLSGKTDSPRPREKEFWILDAVIELKKFLPTTLSSEPGKNSEGSRGERLDVFYRHLINN
ncbi:hypothetical protein TNIN_10441 [Trichonephila inaurata madagascariensis]|uniref:Uncharacterized protein n=1 Tax=Trichonephila inaurata madagascariensis TaxID=2747483 RepID=A0A8X6M852_9ARAC|nr:hypothetical protein TNIN_10441 [Trichonephila inaurata madagascariensis]